MKRHSTYVPLSVRQSRIVTWLWRRTEAGSWFGYDRAKALARRLP